MGYGFSDTGSESPVSMVISVKGVVLMNVSSLANCVSYSLRSTSNFDWMPGFNLGWGGSKYLFSHHLLKSDTISWVNFWLIYCYVIHYGRLKVSYVLSFVKGNVFVGIIRYQYVDRCLPFNLVNTVNDVGVGVSSLSWIVISDKISHMFLNYPSCDLDWYNTLVSWWDFKLWFNCAYCGLLFTVLCVS